LGKVMSALSVGSSNEPQFRILEAAFQKALYLLDIESEALEILAERIERQGTFHVHPLRGDYGKLFASREKAAAFRDSELEGGRMTLITMHHSLYYSPRARWKCLIESLVREVLDSRAGALHSVMMANQSEDIATTTWLYNHFAGRFFDAHNDQDLAGFAQDLQSEKWLGKARVDGRTKRVYFFVEDFEQFMGVIWMILLHPNVHRFSEEQQEEVTEFVYQKLWSKRVPLTQVQDHVMIYTGATARQ
jgi:hypothetical protein